LLRWLGFDGRAFIDRWGPARFRPLGSCLDFDAGRLMHELARNACIGFIKTHQSQCDKEQSVQKHRHGQGARDCPSRCASSGQHAFRLLFIGHWE
jgi:hypothetical protein